MSQYAHRIDTTSDGSLCINLQPHDDVCTSFFQSHKELGCWTNINFYSLDAAELLARDLLTAILQIRETESRKVEAAARFKRKAEAEIKAHVAEFANTAAHTDAF